MSPTLTLITSLALSFAQPTDSELNAAVESGNREEVERLLAIGHDPNATDQFELTALTWAAMKSQVDIARVLLEAGANPNPPPSQIAPGGFPWARAAGVGSLEMVDLLLDAKADVNLKDKEGTTAIFKAAQHQTDPAVIRRLLEAGANINERSDNGMTCLFGAAAQGRVENVRLLIREGATVDVRSNSNETVLIHASFGGHSEIVQILLEAGADPAVKMSDGRTAGDVAAANGHSAVVQLLKESTR
jgi:ankyrin repeat protein